MNPSTLSAPSYPPRWPRVLAVAFAALLFASWKLAVAADSPAGHTGDLPKPVQFLKDHGYEIGQHFDAGHGLVGWVVKKGEASVVFTTKDGGVMLLGEIVDGSGHNVSGDFLAKYAPKRDLKPMYEALGHSTFVAEGQKDQPRRIVYVIFDPNCPYCAVTWRALRPYVNSGIQVRWVPVAYLRPDSGGKVAAILGAPDPAAALAQNEQNYNSEQHSGGIAPAATVPPAVAQALSQNDDIMTRLGSDATPTLVWVDDRGTVASVVGLPDPLKMLEIVGIQAPAAQ